MSNFWMSLNNHLNEHEALGVGSILDAPASKALAKLLTPSPGKPIFPQGTDGGVFIGGTGKVAGYYNDDGGDYYGTRFKPTGGDGTAGWERESSGPYKGKDFGFATGGVTDNSTQFTSLLATIEPIFIDQGVYLFEATPDGTTHVAFELSLGQYIDGMGRGFSASPTELKADISTYVADDVFIKAIGSNNIKGLKVSASALANGTGLKLASTDELVFSAIYRLKEVEAFGFNIGIDIGNIWGSTFESVICRNNKYGMRILPPNDVADNGYNTTLNFKDLTCQNNTDYGLYVAPVLVSRTMRWENLIVQFNNSVSGTYQSYFENVVSEIDTCYFESSPTTYAMQLKNTSLIIDNGYFNNTGGIFIGSDAVLLTMRNCNGTLTNDGIISTGGGINQRIHLEKCNLLGCVFADSTVLTIIDSTINGTYYSYYSSGTPNFSPWVSSAPFGSTSKDRLSYSTTISTTVNTGVTSILVSDQAIGLAYWSDKVTGTASFSDGYFSGLILTVTPGSTGSASFFSVLATNTTGSNITITAKTLNILLERMNDTNTF